MNDLVTKFKIGQLVKYGRFLGLITDKNESQIYVLWLELDTAAFIRPLAYGTKKESTGYYLAEEMEVLVDI